MIFLGFDPGTNDCGYAIVEADGGSGRPIVARFRGGGRIRSDAGFASELIRNTCPHVVAIEWLEGIAYSPKGAGIVPALMSSAAVAGGIDWLTRQLKFRVERITARSWRGTLFAKPQASDPEIKQRLPGLFSAGWPKASNVHVRDAAGCALACAWRELSIRKTG